MFFWSRRMHIACVGVCTMLRHRMFPLPFRENLRIEHLHESLHLFDRRLQWVEEITFIIVGGMHKLNWRTIHHNLRNISNWNEYLAVIYSVIYTPFIHQGSNSIIVVTCIAPTKPMTQKIRSRTRRRKRRSRRGSNCIDENHLYRLQSNDVMTLNDRLNSLAALTQAQAQHDNMNKNIIIDKCCSVCPI